jgi:GTP:adenosylcobinamide-phosphate guanylyltransferase
MIAIICASQIPSRRDPLYPLTRGGYKALIQLKNKPLIQWVLDALSASEAIDKVVVAGLPTFADLHCRHDLFQIENAGDITSNLRAAGEQLSAFLSQDDYVISIPADNPTLRPEMFDWILEQIKPAQQDIYFSMIERSLLKGQFEKISRSFTHLKDIEVTGGRLSAFRLSLLSKPNMNWAQFIDAPQDPLHINSLVGFDAMFWIALRQMTLLQAESNIGHRLGLSAKILLSPYPELGIDIYKPQNLDIIQSLLK